MRSMRQQQHNQPATQDGNNRKGGAPDPVLAAIGRQIRTIREQKGFAQEEFAAHAGIDRSYYGAVERGRYSVTAINLVKIALALEVEVGDLFPSREALARLPSGGEAVR